MHFAEEKGIFILDREGFYPKLGSLTTGSGFAYGAGFRDRDLFANKGHARSVGRRQHQAVLGDRGAADVSAARAQPPASRGLGGHRDYPQENFFGLGPDSDARRSDPSYAIRTNHFGGSRRRPARSAICSSAAGLEYLKPRLGPGQGRSRALD